MNLLCNGLLDGGKFHLARWGKICLLGAMGGWGIKKLRWFSQALCLKSLWHGLFGLGLWFDEFREKYLRNYSVKEWVRK